MGINNLLSFNIVPSFTTTGMPILSIEELKRIEEVVVGRLIKEKEYLKGLPQKTVFGEIRAWRAWNVEYRDGWWLRSTGVGGIWGSSIVTGSDGRGNSSGCAGDLSSGYYALKDKDYLCSQFRDWADVYGEVLLWGNVVEHEHGYRAECMKIVSLFPLNLDNLSRRLGLAGLDVKKRWWRSGLQGIDIIGHSLRQRYLEDKNGDWKASKEVYGSPIGKPNTGHGSAG